MTESHAKAQARVFAMYVKNNRKDDFKVETSVDATASNSIVEYLDNILIAMSNLSMDTERLKTIAIQNATAVTNHVVPRVRGATIKSASEIPRINVSDIKKLLMNKSIIVKFNSNRTDLSIIDDIKSKITEIDKLSGMVEANNDEMGASSRLFITTNQNLTGQPAFQFKINVTLKTLMESFYKEVKDGILPVLKERMDLLTTKLERYTVKNLVGSGRPYKLKYDPMYQF